MSLIYESVVKDNAELRGRLRVLERENSRLRGEDFDFRMNSIDKILMLSADLSACKNLLAVIHRDGGHHTEEVGVVQSAKDAEQKVLAWIAELEVSTRHSLPLLHGSATDERL